MNFLRNLFGQEATPESNLNLAGNDNLSSFLREQVTTAMFVPARLSDGEEIACFLVREDASHVAHLPKQVSIEVRCGLLREANIGLVPVMLRVEGEIYETWGNWHNPYAARCLRSFAQQDKLVIAFLVNSLTPERTLWTPNTLQETFGAMMTELEKMTPWSMSAFDAARERVYQRYPNPQALWAGL
jgi:hypothetical protein